MGREGLIIGGGASGLTAAITAAREGALVTLLEHMPRVGKKILSTGNGRCNMTNLALSASCYRCGEPDFPMKVIGRFPVPETLAFFRRLGIVTTERNGYVYPASGQAQTVLDALREEVESLKIRVICDCGELTVKKDGARFFVRSDVGTFFGDFLILAAGSMAAPATGSDGSGYKLSKAFGHSVKKPLPALVQLRCRGDFFKSVAGVRTEAKVSLYGNGEFLCEDRGELQLTDYGISGIPVFQVSRFAAEALDKKKKVEAVLDFFPSIDEGAFFALLREQQKYFAGRTCESFLNGIFHKKLAVMFLKQAGIRPAREVSELSKRELSALTSLIKGFSIPVTATNPFEQAQVCMGGVKTREVNPSTMESRLVPDLYFAGEILDVDGICGGYNLQWAWSSGYLAGKSAAEKGK